MGFQLGNLYVEKGEKVCGFLKLPFTEDELPVTLIYGQEEGHTVLVDGGIHNAEYVGIECVTGLAAKLQPKTLKEFLSCFILSMYMDLKQGRSVFLQKTERISTGYFRGMRMERIRISWHIL